MKQLVTYTAEQATNMKTLLNQITVTGIDNCKYLAMVAQIMDEGILAGVKEEKEGEDSGVSTVLSDCGLAEQTIPADPIKQNEFASRRKRYKGS